VKQPEVSLFARLDGKVHAARSPYVSTRNDDLVCTLAAPPQERRTNRWTLLGWREVVAANPNESEALGIVSFGVFVYAHYTMPTTVPYSGALITVTSIYLGMSGGKRIHLPLDLL